MSRFTRIGPAVLLVWGAACQPAPKPEAGTKGPEATRPPGNLSAQDEAAVRAVGSEWTRAASAGDGNAIGALYASDATLLPPMEPISHGESAKQYWINLTNGFSGTIVFTATAVEGRGDLAYEVGTYQSRLAPKKAGAKPLPVEEGKYIVIYKKQDDGSWKIIYDIWNATSRAPNQ